jgi:hypothetical protein
MLKDEKFLVLATRRSCKIHNHEESSTVFHLRLKKRRGEGRKERRNEGGGRGVGGGGEGGW